MNDKRPALKVRQPSDLSERQYNIVMLVSKGLADKEIAARLGLTTGTIKVYMSKLRKKIGPMNRSAITRWVMEEEMKKQEKEKLRDASLLIEDILSQDMLDNEPVVRGRTARNTLAAIAGELMLMSGFGPEIQAMEKREGEPEQSPSGPKV